MKWFLVALLSLFGFLFLDKGIELWILIDQVDSNGITVSFLGVKVSGGVLREKLPSFAFGFTVAAVIPILVAINKAFKAKLTKENNHPIV